MSDSFGASRGFVLVSREGLGRLLRRFITSRKNLGCFSRGAYLFLAGIFYIILGINGPINGGRDVERGQKKNAKCVTSSFERRARTPQESRGKSRVLGLDEGWTGIVPRVPEVVGIHRHRPSSIPGTHTMHSRPKSARVRPTGP
jgi:hypothetical protein